MAKQLKVLFVPFKGAGPINACTGLAQVLLRYGHKVVFAVDNVWAKSLEGLHFEIVVLDVEQRTDDPIKAFAEALKRDRTIGRLTPLEKALNREIKWTDRIDYYMKLDSAVGRVLFGISPDVVVIDQFCKLPSVETSGIPWVWVKSAAPLYMYGDDEDVPPCFSGLSAAEDRSVWKSFRDQSIHAIVKPWFRFNEYVVSKGGKPLKEYDFFDGSPYLNIYGYPLELDYSDLKQLPKNYIRFDNLMRNDVHVFEVPKQLTDKPGELIFFSMGSMGGIDVSMMTRLVAILADSRHRFIVSKGPLGDSYELAGNMWGQNSVPQIGVLATVSLVITHGGNNTVTESLYFGKPMIVMPLFGDQYDNAQRIHEKGLGLRLDPYSCGKEELLRAIESLLNDKSLNDKLKNISKRIQSENSIDKFAELIEHLV